MAQPAYCPAALLWRQAHARLTLRLRGGARRDLEPGQVHLALRGRALRIEVLEVGLESPALHGTPALTLWGEVDCAATKVLVTGARVTVTLTKADRLFWPQLVEERFGWIRRDTSLLELAGSDTEAAVRPERGFLGPLLQDGGLGKHYHPGTGGEVLPEQVLAGQCMAL